MAKLPSKAGASALSVLPSNFQLRSILLNSIEEPSKPLSLYVYRLMSPSFEPIGKLEGWQGT